jgi:hypothetical protein
MKSFSLSFLSVILTSVVLLRRHLAASAWARCWSLFFRPSALFFAASGTILHLYQYHCQCVCTSPYACVLCFGSCIGCCSCGVRAQELNGRSGSGGSGGVLQILALFADCLLACIEGLLRYFSTHSTLQSVGCASLSLSVCDTMARDNNLYFFFGFACERSVTLTRGRRPLRIHAGGDLRQDLLPGRQGHLGAHHQPRLRYPPTSITPPLICYFAFVDTSL